MSQQPEKRNGNNYSLEDCAKHAVAHVAYGWSPRPWGHWTAEQVDAYMAAYRAAKNERRSPKS
jgi:hypothetical protein